MDYPTDSRARRLFALDVLRGVAILLVLVRHSPARPRPREGAAEFLLEALTRVGWTGVDLFFVLSGFLISGLLFQEFDRAGRLDLKKFWLRRGCKIWPSYFVAYGLTFLILAATSDAGGAAHALDSWRLAWPNFVFIQNYLPGEYRWPHSWSIAVEEHFYLALPLGLALYARLKARRAGADKACAAVDETGATVDETGAVVDRFGGLARVCVAVCAGVLLWRVVVAAGAGAAWAHVYYPTHLRADALCFGVLLGYAYRYRREAFRAVARRRALLLAAAPVALSLAVVLPLETSKLTQTAGLTIFFLAYGGLVVVAADRPDWGRSGPRPFAWAARAVAAAGVYSYTIYLAHSVVYQLPGVSLLRAQLAGQTAAGRWADRLLFWALSVGLGVLLSHAVERPFLRLRARLLPSDARGRERAKMTPHGFPGETNEARPLP